MKSSVFALVFTLMLTSVAQAGFVEVGASGTYRKSNVGADIFSESYSVTGSISYLFDEMSAIELSYTEGYGKTFVGATTAGATREITNHATMASLDFVLTFGDRDAVLRPYIKAGAGYLINKEITEDIVGFGPRTTHEPVGIVPSAGLGFRLAITKTLSFKAGVDGWSSQPIGKENRNSKIDYAGRAGISWMF
jgi:hypothetical protein